MNKSEKLLVYPFDNHFNPVLRYKEMLNIDVEFIGLISPEGWGLCGKKASSADNGLNIDIIVSADYDEMLNKCDTVWFSETEKEIDFESSIYPKIVDAIVAGKNVITSLDLHDKKDDIKELCEEYNVNFRDLLINDSANFGQIVSSRKIMNEFNVPILSVAGLINDCGKFETQLALRDNFIKQGYKVSQIGSRRGCEILGFHSFPDFMYNEKIKDNHKIILLNNYIKKIENEEKPDVIILGIPGGIMPVSNDDITNYGVTAYMISQAITPDITVLNFLFDQGLDNDYFKKMSNTFKYRFGYEIKCFNLFNKSVDWDSIITTRNITYCTISKNNVEELKENLKAEYDLKIYSLNNKNEMDNMANYLIDTLAEYADGVEILF